MTKKSDVKPVKKIAAPKYPDQYSVELDRLLLANRPLRWSAAPAVCTALSAVVMLSFTSCGKPTMGEPAPPVDTTIFSDDDYVTMGETVAYKFTPLFEHGAGIGVFGCVSVSAPVFLSEDDAFAIIKDEFSKLNLNVTRDVGRIDNMLIPKLDIYDRNKEIETQIGSLEFDFRVENKDIVMEFVSSEDVKAWHVDGDYMSSVFEENYKEAARVLNDSLNNRYDGIVHGIFYEPGEKIQYSQDLFSKIKSEKKLMEEARERANAELREQVRDFIAWLSAQGVI